MRGRGLGKGSPFPSGGAARSQPSSWLKRSAAFRGQSPREGRVQGEETHNLWTSHATHLDLSSSTSAGVRYPSAECKRRRL
jgi:hypothetical protein